MWDQFLSKILKAVIKRNVTTGISFNNPSASNIPPPVTTNVSYQKYTSVHATFQLFFLHILLPSLIMSIFAILLLNVTYFHPFATDQSWLWSCQTKSLFEHRKHNEVMKGIEFIT